MTKPYRTLTLRKMKRARLACLIVPTTLAAVPASAQTPERRISPEAARLIERSIQAHRPRPARVRAAFVGTTTNPAQSKFPFGGSRAHPWTVAIALDERANALAFDTSLAIDGDFEFPTRIGFAGGKGYATRYTGDYDLITAPPPVAVSFLPHLLLQDLLETSRRAEVESNANFDQVNFISAAGSADSLLFDRRTHLLKEIRRGSTPSVYGDQTRETRYGPYRSLGGTMVPTSIRISYHAPALRSYERRLRLLRATPGGPSAAELAIPKGAKLRKAEPTAFQTVSLGRDVYLLRNAGIDGQFTYNVLAIVMQDQVVAVEAALSAATTDRVLEAISKLAPGKPVRTLVQTHHHSDHIGGIRPYIANGATIIAPSGMTLLLQKIAATRSKLTPDALTLTPASARVEEVTGERVIRDQRNTIQLFDLPSEHSAHMLVVYLPEQRVLYQGDLISAGELPINQTSREFLAWLKAKQLPVDVLAGLHGRTLQGAELDGLLREATAPGPAATNEAGAR